MKFMKITALLIITIISVQSFNTNVSIDDQSTEEHVKPVLSSSQKKLLHDLKDE